MVRSSDWGMAGLLLLLAWWVPLPLYLVALSCFALPHVIWEMMWIRRAVAGQLPGWWWSLLGVVLAVQASFRLAAASGAMGGGAAWAADLLTLGAAVVLVLAVPGLRGGRLGWLAGLLALAGAVLLTWVGVAGRPEATVTILVALSVTHNIVPIGLERLGMSNNEPWGSLRWMFLLPLILLVAPALPEPPFAARLPAWEPGELAWLQARMPSGLSNLFSALVLAQCLHYLAILRILPRRLEHGWVQDRWRGPALVAASAMTLGFIWSFPEARRLYGVVAGVHAWIEWPILLCLLGGALGRQLGASDGISNG